MQELFVRRTFFEEICLANPGIKESLLRNAEWDRMIDDDPESWDRIKNDLWWNVFMKAVPVDDNIISQLITEVFSEQERKSMVKQGMSAIQTMASFSKWQKMFVVSPGLFQRLILTDLHGVSSENLKLPYSDFAISIPKGIFQFEEIYVSKLQDKIKFTLIMHRHVNSWNSQDKKSGAMQAIMKRAEMMAGARTLIFDIGGDDLGKVIEREVSMLNEKSQQILVGILKFVLNIILYINFKRADSQTVRLKRSSDEKMNRKIIRDYSSRLENPTLLGGLIVIDKTMEKESLQYGPGHYMGGIMWTVRGHWRRLSSRKITHPDNPETWCTWIEPYVKGNLDGEFVNKKYSTQYLPMEGKNGPIKNATL